MMLRCSVAIVLFLSTVFAIPLHAHKRYIAIHGGGLAGLAPVLWIKEVERVTGKKIGLLVDGIAGNSVGAVIGASICSPESPFYAHDYEQTFIANAREIPLGPVCSYARSKDQILDRMLKRTFGAAQLSQAKPHFVAFAYNRVTEEMIGFDSLAAKERGFDLPIWEAVRASSTIDLPCIGPFVSFTAHFEGGSTISGLSDPGLHGASDPVPELIHHLERLYPAEPVTIYSLGTGGGPVGIQHFGHIEVIRIEPDISVVCAQWPGWFRSFLPVNICRTDSRIEDVKAAARTAMRSDLFLRMVQDLKAVR